jgi:hypothetical protein
MKITAAFIETHLITTNTLKTSQFVSYNGARGLFSSLRDSLTVLTPPPEVRRACPCYFMPQAIVTERIVLSGCTVRFLPRASGSLSGRVSAPCWLRETLDATLNIHIGCRSALYEEDGNANAANVHLLRESDVDIGDRKGLPFILISEPLYYPNCSWHPATAVANAAGPGDAAPEGGASEAEDRM